ncbi:Agamous-like MADS-box protein AGL82 [Linum perenne]
MGHKRVKMELIKNERSRMQTYKKRKANLLKKIKEFIVLCDVKACLVIFGPAGELETWSPESCTLLDLIQQYRTSDQPKRTYSVSDYFAEKKKRVDVELAKLRKQVYEQKFLDNDGRLDGLSADQLRMVLESVDSKLKAADERIAALEVKRNLGLVQRATPITTWMNRGIPDVGFGIEREIENGYPPKLDICSKKQLQDDDVQDLSRHFQFEHQESVYSYYDNLYPNNSFLFPGEGGQNFYAPEIPFGFQPGELSPPEDQGINFGLMQAQKYPAVLMQQQQQEMVMKNQVMGRNGVHSSSNNQGLLSSLLGISSSSSWSVDSGSMLGNSDAGMSFITSSYQPILPQVQFSPMAGFTNVRMMFPHVDDSSIGGSFEFGGRDYKL